jgi:Protein of unknown function (DUF3300)
MKAAAILIMAVVAMMATEFVAFAQVYAPPEAQTVPLVSATDLEQLLSPIALYPDPLIAEILPAATQPSEIVVADRYVSSGGDLSHVDLQPWDPSVKALARYPNVLRWMDDNLPWTTQLGQAFLYQQADVMEAMQRLRARALALGNLQSTPQQSVINDNGTIEIVPANPQVVYLPVYQPDLVYAQPPPQPGFYVSFGAALPLGVWLNHDFDWHHHDVIVWHNDHPRPPDWWSHRPGRDTREIQRDASVWQPRNRSAVSEVNRESRGWGSSTALPPVVRSEPRQVPERRPAEPRPAERVTPEPRQVARPGPGVSSNGRVVNQPQPGVVQRQATEPRPTQRPNPGPQTPQRPPVANTAPRSSGSGVVSSRSPTGALIGVHSAPETHQYSVRGQESRQAMGSSAPVRSSAPAPARAVTPAPSSRTPSAPASTDRRNKR